MDVCFRRTYNEYYWLLQNKEKGQNLWGELSEFWSFSTIYVQYVMYIVNGFIYIGAAIVLLVFHAQGMFWLLSTKFSKTGLLTKQTTVGLHYIILSKMYYQMQQMSNLTCQKEAINELSKLINNPVDPLNDNWPTQPLRHEDDTFSDMIFALVIWLCIMFLTVLNVIVAIIEIKRWVWAALLSWKTYRVYI